MVDWWGPNWRSFCQPVEQAMRTVPRHVFLPGFPIDEAYAEQPVVTHRDADGAALSSASQPSCVAGMLERLDVQLGHRVLEIGAGTGYNAALLAHLSGLNGRVTSIDIIPSVAEDARRHLAAAGYGNVHVVCDDGELGCAEDAPYDRIIVTAGAWDIPPAWLEQLAPGGRIVIPLRIRGFTCEIALEREGQGWRSRSCEPSGFIPMRGAEYRPERDVPVAEDGKAELRIEGDLPADPEALRRAVEQPPVEIWTGVSVINRDLTSLEYWLACLDGLGRLITRRPGHGLASPTFQGGSLAVIDTTTGDTFAYFTFRPADGTSDEAESVSELGIYAYGPRGDQLAGRVADRVRTWAAEHPALTTWIEVYPVGTPVPSQGDELIITEKRHVRVVVRSGRRA